ncbi:hypothetical protein CYMTET_21662 [Cymbomonas tetramitiformis]|uniref:Uncharacterized protein n=1 Tax=Cymbomonas tetramitiformis TaxID=36881 RepID=A0AAE0L301_9CHLO|nr:hypothetical protein CYMTET_21662 [Cymbomonas tetramitiformis]
MAATFGAALRTLQRDHFDVKVAKCVQRKLFGEKEQRFTGVESHVGALFPRLVCALREVFVTEDALFVPLFTLHGATAPVRVEANHLLYSTLELLVDPNYSPAADWMDSSSAASPLDGKRVLLEFARRILHCDDPFQGTPDLLDVRVVADKDPHDVISDCNARGLPCTTATSRPYSSKPWTRLLYQPVVSRLPLHDQRENTDLLTMQQWARECFSTHERAKPHAALSVAYTGRRFGDLPEP